MKQKAESKMRSFAENIALGLSGAQSARDAGYQGTKGSLATKACLLLKNADVIRWIEEARKKASTKRVLTAQERREFLSGVVEHASEMTRDKVSAVKVLNDMDGLTIKKVHHAGHDGNSLVDELAGVTVEALRERVRKLKGAKK